MFHVGLRERETSVLPVLWLFNGLGLQIALAHLARARTHVHTYKRNL